MKKRLVLMLVFTASGLLYAQKTSSQLEIDKLYNQAITVKNNQPQEALVYLRNALQISSQNKNYVYGKLAIAFGNQWLRISAYDSAGKYYHIAENHFTEQDPELSAIYVEQAYLAYKNGQYEKSLALNLKAEKLARVFDDKAVIAKSIKILGFLDLIEQRYAEALKHFEQSLAFCEQAGDTINLIHTLNNLAASYQHFDEFEKSEQMLKRALALGEKINCSKCMASSYSELGINDFYWGKYERSISYYQKENELNRKNGETFYFFFPYQNISESLIELNRLDQALMYNDSAIYFAKSNHALQHIHDAYKARYSIYKKLGNDKYALQAFETQMQYKDSIFNNEKTNIIENLRATFDAENKERQIVELEQSNQIKDLEAQTAKIWQLGLIAFMVLLGASLWIVYSRYRLKATTTKALDEKNNQLNAANEFKNRILAIVSHDLKSPLSSFSSITSTLNEYYDQIKPEDVRTYLSKLSNSARTLEEQMKNLLEWAISQLTVRELKLESIGVLDSVQMIKGLYQLNLEIKQIQIYFNVPDDLVIWTDREYFHTILRNLISNAIKFTPINGSIWISAKSNGNQVSIQVKDSGIGIAKEHFDQLFSLAADKKAIGASTEKGTGLGLVLVKELMDRLDNQIHFDSKLGEGTIFTLEFSQSKLLKTA